MVRSDLLDYATEIEWFDEHLGRMLDMLEETGELDNTLVIVTSDNGMAFPRARANVYEYGIHVPLAVRWGDETRGGRITDDVVSLVDPAPTILEAAGVPHPGGYPMEGLSLLAFLRSGGEGDAVPGRDAVFSARERHSSSRYGNRSYPQRAVRTKRYRYIRNFEPDRWPAGAPRKFEAEGTLGRMHDAYHDIDAAPMLSFLIEGRDSPQVQTYLHLAVARRPAEELFDVAADPACLYNLAADPNQAETARRLREMPIDFLEKTGDPGCSATVTCSRAMSGSWDRCARSLGRRGRTPRRRSGRAATDDQVCWTTRAGAIRLDLTGDAAGTRLAECGRDIGRTRRPDYIDSTPHAQRPLTARRASFTQRPFQPGPRRLSMVKKSILYVLLFVLCGTSAVAQEVRQERGTLVTEGIPEIPAALAERLQQYENIRSASLQDWLPRGAGILITTRFGETDQFHRVETPVGARHQITFFDEPVGGGDVSPDFDVNGFVYQRDVGGSEFYQLYFFDFATGTSRLLTDGTSRNGGALWSTAGDRIAYFTTQRNGRDWDIHIRHVETDEVTPALEKEGVWFPEDWSPDDETLLVRRYVSINESHLYLLDLNDGALTPLQSGKEKVAYGGAVFAGDGAGVYFVSDEGSEFQRLRYRDLRSDATHVLTEDIDWDVERLEISDDGRHLAFTVNEEGYSRLYVMDTMTEDRLDVPSLPLGVVGNVQFGPDGRIALTLDSPTSADDVYVMDIHDGTLVRWTQGETGGLDPAGFVTPELVRFETFDEADGMPRTIPALVYKPAGAGPFPVVVDIHGGPEGQERPTFSGWTQFLVREMGVAVVAPNVRGSSGYGKSYLLLDNGFRREDSVRDIGELLDWIAEQPDLDADRVSVYGGSYGGYMVLSSMTHYNDRLRAGVEAVGISNFVTFLENTQDYRRDLRRVEYGDERDPEMRAFLERISPTTNAEKITRPLFVAQGLNDPRVPATESEQMVAKIRENGGDVWYMLATDEGHGFRKKTNRDYFMQAAALFLETHLMGKPPKATGSR